MPPGNSGTAGPGWVGTAVAVLTSGAVLRVTGRVFAGWGPSHEVLGVPGSKIPEKRETHGGRRRTPLVMKAPAAALLVFALAVGFAPSLAGSAHREAAFFVHRVAYAERVLDGISPTPPPPREVPVGVLNYLKGTAGAAGAAALAMAALFGSRLRLPRLVRGGLRGLRELHSGIVCDYVAWLTAGVAARGALAFVFLR